MCCQWGNRSFDINEDTQPVSFMTTGNKMTRFDIQYPMINKSMFSSGTNRTMRSPLTTCHSDQVFNIRLRCACGVITRAR